MSAVILEMPRAVQRRAKRRFNRAELNARHSWMMENYRKWETTELDGEVHESPAVQMLMDAMREAWAGEFSPLTNARMNKDISEGRKVIVKRNQAKAWLKSLGADLESITSSEEALFFLFDRLAAKGLAL